MGSGCWGEEEEKTEVEVELDYNLGGLISYKEPSFYVNGTDYQSSLVAQNSFSRVLNEALQELEKAGSVSDFKYRESSSDERPMAERQKTGAMDRGFLNPQELLGGRNADMIHLRMVNRMQKIKRSLVSLKKKTVGQVTFVRR